jgi:hypothetical protein
MMKRFLAGALIVATLYGCGEEKIEKLNIGGDVVGSPVFKFPGSIYRLESKPNENAATKRAWFFEQTEWKPHGWSLWLAANVYSDAKAPRGDLDFLNKGFVKASSAAERSKAETAFLSQISKYVHANKVDLEINYLGYDSLPDSLVKRNDNSYGYWLTFNNEPCEKAFRLCIDNYFVSPAARYSGTGRLSFKDWITPFLPQGNSERASGQQYVIDSKGGSKSESSPFYDLWPSMVFLVNPEGKVVRAWLPQKNDHANVYRVEAAIVSDIGGPYKDLKLTEDNYPPGVPHEGYYGKYYIEAGIDNLLGTFKLILDKK